MAYRPIDRVGAARALMVIGVEDDPVAPSDHCTALFNGAPAPKKLVMQRHTTHYAAYEQYADDVIPEMVGWFASHLVTGPIDVRETDSTGEVRRVMGQTPPPTSGRGHH